MLNLLPTLLLILCGAYLEMRLGQKLAKEFDSDGIRTKVENLLIHSSMVPHRVLIIILIWTSTCPRDHESNSVLFIFCWFMFCGFFYWLVFDILCAKVWLRIKGIRGWFYLGHTSKIDIEINTLGIAFEFILKIVGLLGSGFGIYFTI